MRSFWHNELIRPFISGQAASWSLQYDSAKELCFASLPIGAGICSGDSGAPIVSYSNDIGEWVQVRGCYKVLVPWYSGCNVNTAPEV